MLDCESLFTHLKTEKMIAGTCYVRYFLSAQRALKQGGLRDACWLLGAENPAAAPTKVRSDIIRPLRFLESGRFNPGSLRPRKWATGVRKFGIRILACASLGPVLLCVLCVLFLLFCGLQRGFRLAFSL